MSLTLTSTTGTPNGYKFRLNDLYDPDYTGIGNQPYYYDQMIALYKAFVVTGSKVKITATGSSNMKVTLRPSTSTALATSVVLERERPNSKYMYVTAQGDAKSITSYMSSAQIFGRSKACILNEDDFRGVGSYPTQVAYWDICTQHVDGASTASIYVDVEITYYTKWMNRRAVAQS